MGMDAGLYVSEDAGDSWFLEAVSIFIAYRSVMNSLKQKECCFYADFLALCLVN
jgi:hypothetical protein